MKENLKTWFKSFFSKEEQISHAIEIDLIDKEIEKFNNKDKDWSEIIERSKKWHDRSTDEKYLRELTQARRLGSESLVKELQNFSTEELNYYNHYEKAALELNVPPNELPWSSYPHNQKGSLEQYSDNEYKLFEKMHQVNTWTDSLEKEINRYKAKEDRIFSNESIKDYLNIENKDKLANNRYYMTERFYENRDILHKLHSHVDMLKDLKEVAELHKEQFKSKEVADTYIKVITTKIEKVSEHFEPLINSAFMISILRSYNKAYEDKYVKKEESTNNSQNFDIEAFNTYKIPEVNIESMKNKIHNIRNSLNVKNVVTKNIEKP